MPALGKQLLQIERITLVLAAALIAAAFLALPRHLALSASVGAGLMCVNAWSLRRIGERTLQNEARLRRPGAVLLLFNLKMFALIGLIIVAVRVLHLDAIGFLLGVSVFPVAVLVAGIRAALADPDSTDPDSTDNDPVPPAP